MLEAYTGFIRNVKRADDAIRLARSIKPAFDRFLQVKQGRRGGGCGRGNMGGDVAGSEGGRS